MDNYRTDKGLEGYVEEDLVKMAQKGDEEAEEFLIRRYKDLVKSKAQLYFMVGADKEDVVQEGMIGIFKAIRGFDGTRQASFRTFVELCVNRQIITAIKGATRMKHSPLNTSVSLSRPVSEETKAVNLEEMLTSNSDSDPEAMLLLKEMMKHVGSKEAGIFSDLELRVWNEYLSGKNCAEIAKITNKSPKAIDNAIQRTKKKLYRHLFRKNG